MRAVFASVYWAHLRGNKIWLTQGGMCRFSTISHSRNSSLGQSQKVTGQRCTRQLHYGKRQTSRKQWSQSKTCSNCSCTLIISLFPNSVLHSLFLKFLVVHKYLQAYPHGAFSLSPINVLYFKSCLRIYFNSIVYML